MNDTQPRKDWSVVYRSYKLPDGLGMNARIAHLLDWTAKHHEGLVVPYNVILKIVMGLPHTPRMNSDQVDKLRRKIPACRPLLQTQYHRDLKNVSGVGARATTGSLDVVKNSMGDAVRRVNSAHDALTKKAALVDAAELPNQGPDKRWTQWYARTVSPALKALSNDARIAALLPPAKDDAESSAATPTSK